MRIHDPKLHNMAHTLSLSVFFFAFKGTNFYILFTLECRLLMRVRISKGPRTLPCGTPEVTGEVSEQEPLGTTSCILPDR